MKKQTWSTLDLSSASVSESWVLVPETDSEQKELLGVLDNQGIRDRLIFTMGGINASLSLPNSLQWSSDGAVQLSVTAASQVSSLWFWVVEIAEPSPRRFVWWSATWDRDSAQPWTGAIHAVTETRLGD